MERRRAAFAAGIDRAEALRDAGDDVLVVLLCEAGFEADVDASLARLTNDCGGGRMTTIVVTPFPEMPEDLWAELAPPYKAQIVLERRRAKKRLFPAIDPSASLSDALNEQLVGPRHVEVVLRAKALLESYQRIDPSFDLFGADRQQQSNPTPFVHIVCSAICGNLFWLPSRSPANRDNGSAKRPCSTPSKRSSISDLAGARVATSGALLRLATRRR